ncbi:MAG: hypothetical protein CL531_09485, partial [Aestuariibacter sp.]|nr:hypothetical protein [Aestuariibacter sp.]
KKAVIPKQLSFCSKIPDKCFALSGTTDGDKCFALSGTTTMWIQPPPRHPGLVPGPTKKGRDT